MPDLILWKDKQIKKMKEDMDRLFKDFFREFGLPSFADTLSEMPSVKISEADDSVIITAEIPGMDPENFDILVSDQFLILEGTRKEQFVRQGSTVERSGTFRNRLRLPCKVEPDKVEASYKNNQLQIVLPKCKKTGFHKIPLKHG